ncbi:MULTISPECIES: PAAR domain-containing protein [unclassified Leclercia]|uniref:PAAR domain-containing protein n=1 Tax=Leclercia barmai TaxID=2785629 RepID=A0ABS7RVV4_9ENTR|nr:MULTISPECIES: PAAR domain-containing protein [unclassified Leclercia]MBZ0058435.1 PAAR domain-containing protein [Leclercia sp. EMC7]MCM5697856.1 PAAR domain-containing protein [Leclercia sp. LTM01]MCM5700990.1 PAAR domain-containing protein [Leclercia sp. LTM14]
MSNRSTWDGIPEGLHGDETTTGAQGLSSLPNFSNAHLGALRHGDKTTPCPKCGEVGEIIGNIPTMNLEGKIAAGNGAEVICGCPIGSNILISPAGQWIGNTPRPEPAWINSSTEPEQHAQAAKKKRIGVDAGFCVVPQTSTTESFESILFAGGQPEGTRELYRSLNGSGKEYKAGSIMLVVDPDKQDSEQIAHMKAAKQRIDTVLEPLTHEEANFLHKHYATIANFSNIADKGIGLAADPVGKYFENIEKILKEIQETYKNTYMTRGALIGEQFYVRRAQLFTELDRVLKVGFLNKAMKFGEYTKIKNALGLSTSSITYKWNETGISDIEGYATHIERAAKYTKAMRYAGYVGIAFSAVHSINEINEACSTGREAECTKKKYTEIGSFSGGLAGGLAGGAIGMGICSLVLGSATMAAGGAGALACGVILGTSAGYVGGELSSSGGEAVGEFIYNSVGQ